ncbi:MAG: tetratricopeptide repeat protein [Fibrobacteraceae bacterium]|nr:tetratricopeptide repeat protein [Fibrobacteraceae bacterium]
MAQVVDISVENFESEVMAASETKAVVLSFSSAQMPECAEYDALLSKLSSELDFTLGKVSLDKPENEAFIQSFQIRSLPDVRVLLKGEMADVIQGKLPEAELKKRLEKFFVSEEERAKRGLEDAIANGHFGEAKAALEAVLKQKPDDDHSKLLLAKCELNLGDSDRAKALLLQIPELSSEHAQAKSLLELMEFFVEASKTDAVSPEDMAFHEACIAASEKEYGKALQEFFNLAMSAPAYKDGAARKAMITLFGVLGAKDPLTWEFRSKLNSALFI